MMRALLVALLVAGCGSTPEPSIPAVGNVFRVEMSQQHFGTIAAFIHDEAGLVMAAEKGITGDVGQVLGDADAVALVDDRNLKVAWIGGACRFGPTVTLTGDSEELTVTIRPEAGDGLPQGIVCSAIGLFFAINVTLATPVDQQAIDLRVVR